MNTSNYGSFRIKQGTKSLSQKDWEYISLYCFISFYCVTSRCMVVLKSAVIIDSSLLFPDVKLLVPNRNIVYK